MRRCNLDIITDLLCNCQLVFLVVGYLDKINSWRHSSTLCLHTSQWLLFSMGSGFGLIRLVIILTVAEAIQRHRVSFGMSYPKLPWCRLYAQMENRCNMWTLTYQRKLFFKLKVKALKEKKSFRIRRNSRKWLCQKTTSTLSNRWNENPQSRNLRFKLSIY